MSTSEQLTAEEIAALAGADDDANEHSRMRSEAAARSPAGPVELPLESSAFEGSGSALTAIVVPTSSADSLAPRSESSFDVIRLVRGLHERLARLVANAWSPLLRTKVDVRLQEVELAEYRQFVLDVESPTCLAVLRAEPLDIPLALDLPPQLLFPMLACLLGGRSRPENPPQRPLTEIEERLAARLVRTWNHELRSVWRDIAPLECYLDRWEVHPHRASLAPLREPLVVSKFRVSFGTLDGIVHFALPRRALDELSAGIRATGRMPLESNRSDSIVAERLAARDDEDIVEFCLAETRIALADLRSLRIGDVLATDHATDAPVLVIERGEPIFAARPGIVNGRRAVRIEPLEASVSNDEEALE